MKKKIIIDILMLILIILEYSRNYINPILHEIFGIVLIVLLIIHLTLNINYIKNILKGKYNRERIITLTVNILLFISFIASIILGILSSQELLKFMNIGNIKVIELHKIISYITLIILGIHIGLNLSKMIKPINIKLRYILGIIISIFGIYSFFDINIIKHITGEYGFISSNKSFLINILEYLSIVITISIITNIINKIMRKEYKNER